MKKYHVILQRHNRRNYVGEVIKEIDVYARTNNEARYKAIEELGDLYQYYSDSGHPDAPTGYSKGELKWIYC